RRKARYGSGLLRQQRSRLRHIGAGEVVTSRAILHAESIEIGIGHESAVSRLPCAYMYARNRQGVFGYCRADDHDRGGAAARREPSLNASSSALVSGLRKNDSCGISRASMPCLRRVSATTGPTAATNVLVSADLASCSDTTAISRSTCAELVKATASILRWRSCSTNVRTACSSAASA